MSHSKGSGDSDMSENEQLGLASGAIRSKDLGLPLRRSSRLRNRNKTDIEDLDDGLVADDEESRPLEGRTKEENSVDTGAMENCHTQGEWEVFLIMRP